MDDRARDLADFFVARGEFAAAFEGVPDKTAHPTSAKDIVGWCTEHYREYVPDIARMLAARGG